MAELTFTNINQLDPVVIAEQTLTASDTFTFTNTSRTYLQVNNATGGDLTITITGTGLPVDVSVGGYGKATFTDIQLTVADNTVQTLNLSNRIQMLQGTVTVTGGTGAKVILFSC